MYYYYYYYYRSKPKLQRLRRDALLERSAPTLRQNEVDAENRRPPQLGRVHASAKLSRHSVVTGEQQVRAAY